MYIYGIYVHVFVILSLRHFVKSTGERILGQYAWLGEMRSILSPYVKTMALTATATKKVSESIVTTLGIANAEVVSVSPDKSNIAYNVSSFKSINQTFGPIMEQVARLQNKTPRCIIFCQTWTTAHDCIGFLGEV